MNLPSRPTRILIADDHAIVRDGVKFVLSLEPNLEVIAEASDGNEAVRLALELCPDLLLLDLGLPGMNGVDAALRIKQSNEQIKILIFTGSLETNSVRRALAAGADGYVLKQENSDELMSAIRALIAGRRYISKNIAEQFNPLQAESAPASMPSLAALTEREREVVIEVAQGLSSEAIAERLFISVATVRKHRENIMRKLNLHNAAEIAAVAVKYGLYDPV